MKPMRGVLTICPTPFFEDGEVDVESIDRLVDFQIKAKISGLAVLGFLGEQHKLSSVERHLIIERFVQRADQRVPVWVGVRALGLRGAIEQAREAEALGASAVFVAPLDGVNDQGQFSFYKSVAESITIPVVIHDFPDSFGTEISPAVVARLALEKIVKLIKMEEPPVGPKITEILQRSGHQCDVFGGLGGVYFLEELKRGAVGTMTGFAFPEILVSIYQHYTAGDIAAAERVFDRYCPLIRYEFQPKLGLALRKYTYFKRGLLSSAFVRAPGMQIDPYSIQELESVIARVGLDLNQPGVFHID